MKTPRRKFIRDILGGSVPLILCGCGSGGSGPYTDESYLNFEDTDHFYSQLSSEINSKKKVRVSFDGSSKLSRESKMVQDYLKNAANAEDVFKDLRDRDSTENGRKELSMIFTDDLLEHEAVRVQEPNGVKLQSGEVIEPLTVVVVIAVLVLVGTVAHAEIKSNRKYRISFGGNYQGMQIVFESEP